MAAEAVAVAALALAAAEPRPLRELMKHRVGFVRLTFQGFMYLCCLGSGCLLLGFALGRRPVEFVGRYVATCFVLAFSKKTKKQKNFKALSCKVALQQDLHGFICIIIETPATVLKADLKS